MSLFVLFLRRNQAEQLAVSEDEVLARFMTWTSDLRAKGMLKHVERLKPPSEGATVRMVGTKPAVKGPYAEDSEALVGIYIIEAPDYGAAHAAASECPIVQIGGSVEIRETEIFPGR